LIFPIFPHFLWAPGRQQGGETPETLGPFSWAPKAMEMVTFGQKQGLAVASFADIEIWVKLTGWSKLSRWGPKQINQINHQVSTKHSYSIDT
jgi:hypothetical protein